MSRWWLNVMSRALKYFCKQSAKHSSKCIVGLFWYVMANTMKDMLKTGKGPTFANKKKSVQSECEKYTCKH